MMWWKGAVFLLVGLVTPVCCQGNNFMGGLMTYRLVDTSLSAYRFRISAITSWKLGHGPCGNNCTAADVGSIINITRSDVMNVTGNDYYGRWYQATSYSSTNTTDITERVSREFDGHVIGVNRRLLWEQEMASFDLDIDRRDPWTDISLQGDYWRDVDYEGGTDVPYQLQVNLTSLTRSDTGIPNNSPVVMFQPVYRIPLNNVTTFRLTTYDSDDDFVHCEMSTGILKPIPNVTVNTDCTVRVSAMESDGFIDGGWGVVTVSVSDFNRRPLVLHNNLLNISNDHPVGGTGISSVPLQFLIQTVRELDGPQFVDPTFTDGHEFIVAVGSELEIPLYASSVFGVDVFFVKSIPYREFVVAAPNVDPSRVNDSVSYAMTTWTPQTDDVGVHVLGITVMDSRGQTGRDRNYIVTVKDVPVNILPHQPRPYFVYTPVDSAVTCVQDSTCTFSLYTVTNDDSRSIQKVTVVYSTLPGDLELTYITRTLHQGTKVFRADVSVTSSLTGHQIACFKALDNAGDESHTECIRVTLLPPDPCLAEPCGMNECQREGSLYRCICRPGFTGVHCETALHECASSPCVHGTCRTNPLIPGRYQCICTPPWSGDNCQIDTGTAEHSVSPTATAQTMPTKPSSTPSANSCRDASNVDCSILDAETGICALGNNLTHTFCPRYCRVCVDVTLACEDSVFVDCPGLDKTSGICGTRSPVATLFCPRYCRYCTVPPTTTPTPTTTVKPTLCTECAGVGCLVASKVVACPPSQPYCLTRLTNMDTGATSYAKSCANRTECQAYQSRLTPHQHDCSTFSPMEKYYEAFSCTYCCVSDHCNAGGYTIPRRDTLLTDTSPDIIG